MVGLHVSQSPWFGLGYGEMPEDINHSIDSLWLVLASNPASLALFLSRFRLWGLQPF